MTVDCALAKHQTSVIDPVYPLTLAPILSLCRAVWDSWIPFQWIALLWDDAFRTIDEECGDVSWHKVADPMAAAAASISRAGWTNGGVAKFVTRDCQTIDIRKVAPRTIKVIFTRDLELELLTAWGA